MSGHALILPYRSGDTTKRQLVQSEFDELIGGIPNLRYWFSGQAGRKSETSLIDRVAKEDGKWPASSLPPAYASARFGNKNLLDFSSAAPVYRLRTTSKPLVHGQAMTFINLFELAAAPVPATGQLVYTHDGTEESAFYQIRMTSTGVQLYLQSSSSPVSIAKTWAEDTAYFVAMSVKFTTVEGVTTRSYRAFVDTLTPAEGESTVTAPTPTAMGFGVGPQVSAVSGVRVADALAFDRYLDVEEVALAVAWLRGNYGI